MLKQFQPEGFDVFAGSEVFLLSTLRGGGAGCITATGNVNPSPMVALYKSWQGTQADAQQAKLDAARAVFQKYSMIPAMKAAIAKYGKKDSWKTVRPPLVQLSAEQEKALLDSLEAIGFQMPGI
jgi:4-hydroxy-tetrahydrodipicolinate synthase